MKVKGLILFILIFLNRSINYGQTDTINKIDANRLKQGWWIVMAGDIAPLPINYDVGNKYEEGRYVNGKREGPWIKYHSNGKIALEYTYKDGKINGPAKSYFMNGCIGEEGTFKLTRWVGEYKNYHFRKDSCGKIQSRITFDQSGKKVSSNFYANSQKSKENKDTIWSWPHYNKQDSLRLEYCSCDSIIANGETTLDIVNNKPVWNGKGNYKLYRKDRKLSKCGYFYKARLIYGFEYFYNEDGKVDKITKYFNGSKIGACYK